MCHRHAADAVDDRIEIRPGYKFTPLLHQTQLQHLVISVSLTARRLPPLAPQVSQIGDAALAEQKAVTLPLDHAFGFELADVRAAAFKVLRQSDALTVAVPLA